MNSEYKNKSEQSESLLGLNADEFSVTRRDFLAIGAAATAGIYLAGSKAVAKQSDYSDKSPGNFNDNVFSLLKNIEVYLPKDENYKSFLEGLFSGEAGLKKPSAIVCPKSHEDIMQFIKVANDEKLMFTVCGGGLSSLSVQTGIICLALNVYYNQVEVLKRKGRYFVKACGGAKVGEILAHLKHYGHHIPVGVSPLPGLGLIMRGGIGHLSRSEGLTCDYISKVHFITARGDNLLLDAECAEQELWNAVRGAAPRFGIVSEVYLRVAPGTKVTLSRLVTDISVLKNWLEHSDELQDRISASLVLGSDSAQHMNPVLYGYLVHQRSSEDAVVELNSARKHMTGAAELTWHEEAHTVDYTQMPTFDVPLRDSGEFSYDVISYVKSYLIKNSAIKNMCDVLLEAIRTAPNQFCRIDLQHLGGRVRRIKNGSVFRGRDADWNLVVTGIYYAHSSAKETEQAVAWVKDIMHQLNAAVTGVYSVEIRNNTPETQYELEKAFQDKLGLLHKLSKKYDPHNLISHYPL